MNITTWPVRALFKYVYQRVLGTFIRTDLDLNDIDFSASSFAISDIELNTFEINKMLQTGDSVPPFKLVNASVKHIDIPWGIFKLGQGTVELEGVDIILMPCGTKKTPRRRSKDDTEEGEKVEEVEEVSISTTIVTKFLSNVGVKVRDIAIKVVSCEFGKEGKGLEETPTVMMRVNHVIFERSGVEGSAPLEETAEVEEVEEGEGSLMDTTVHERPIPHILMVLKSKVLRVGQISLHLLSSPFGSEIYQNSSKWKGMEFPYSFPPINHLTTLLCVGNPDEPNASCFNLSMTQSDSDKKLFKIRSKIT